MAPADRGGSRRAVLASLTGSVAEYYDFFLFGVASALIFPRVFFPGIDSRTATVAAFAIFGVGQAARPIGAVVLGHLGDRRGRKNTFATSIMLMGASTLGIGLIPSYERIGVLAPVCLTVMRVLQGFSVGGEQAGATAMTFEHAPRGRRAFFTSSTVVGAQIGLVLATSIYIPFSLLPDDVFFAWAWRIPFLLSIVVLGIGLYVRRHTPESPAFHREQRRGAVPTLPVVTLARHHKSSVFRVVFCSLAAAVSTVTGIYGLNFAVAQAGLERVPVLTVIVAANILAVVAIPFFASMSDRFGQKLIFVGGSLCCVPFIFLYFMALQSRDYVLIGLTTVATYSVAYGAVSAAWPSFFAQMFPTGVRYSGVAIGTQIGFAATGFAPTIAAQIAGEGPDGWRPVAWLTAGACLVAAVCALSYRGPSRGRFNDEGQGRLEHEA